MSLDILGLILYKNMSHNNVFLIFIYLLNMTIFKVKVVCYLTVILITVVFKFFVNNFHF